MVPEAPPEQTDEGLRSNSRENQAFGPTAST
jgi:hypothetical protein